MAGKEEIDWMDSFVFQSSDEEEDVQAKGNKDDPIQIDDSSSNETIIQQVQPAKDPAEQEGNADDELEDGYGDDDDDDDDEYEDFPVSKRSTRTSKRPFQKSTSTMHTWPSEFWPSSKAKP